jgi:murein DD-endopeptidase MepM/ murein hydrolase activator NlpD
MPKNKYTVFISPPRAGKSRYFSLHIGTFYMVMFFILAFIIGDCIAIIKYLENNKLIQENSTLKNEKEELEKIAKIVEEIEKNEAFIEDFLGLGKAGSNTGTLGLGQGQGGETSDILNEPLISFIEPSSAAPPDQSDPTRTPVERALLLNRNLEGIIDVLLDRKSKWDTKPSILPVETDRFFITSGFGWRTSPFTGRRQFHRGMDISSRRGTPVIAPADGTISRVGRNPYIGRFIEIMHNETYTTLYGHLLETKVVKGQKVKRGKLIGLMGNTGMSTGHHLHYEVYENQKTVNPAHFILNTQIPQMMLAKK